MTPLYKISRKGEPTETEIDQWLPGMKGETEINYNQA